MSKSSSSEVNSDFILMHACKHCLGMTSPKDKYIINVEVRHVQVADMHMLHNWHYSTTNRDLNNSLSLVLTGEQATLYER